MMDLRRLAPLLVFVLLCALTPAAAQSMRLDVFNTRFEMTGRLWASGNLGAFCTEEEAMDLNGDGDTDDAIACVTDFRTLQTRPIGLAVSYQLLENEQDWPIAISGDWVAVQVNETDQGKRDLNGNGTTTDDVLHLYNFAARKTTNLGVVGRQPTFHGGKLYFVQPEIFAHKDLNADGDMNDMVLCSYDLASGEIESLGMDATLGFRVAGDWIVTMTSEASQGAKDLNGDGDIADVVAQLYQISRKQWTNTRLECAAGLALTPQLLAVAVDESRQGNQDLNGDGDKLDQVCEVWNLATGHVFNTQQDCGSGLAADGGIVGFVTREKAQGNKDLNGDGDAEDEVVQVVRVGTDQVENLLYDGSGGIAAGAGKIAFSCYEASQGNKDLNKDRDTEDYVLMYYDPVRNRIVNTGWAVDGDLFANEGVVGWKVLEADQGNRDINRDGDTDDSIACALDLATGSIGISGYASGLHIAPCSRGILFAVPEMDQGNKDLNGDGDTDDDVTHVGRITKK